MNFDEYQKKARSTAIYPDLGNNLVYPTLGLVGEAGEFAERVKKVIRDHDGQVTQEYLQLMIGELGDILWYVANLCEELQLRMDGVAAVNIEKLQSRKDRNKLHGDGDTR